MSNFVDDVLQKAMIIVGLILFANFLPLVGKDKHFLTMHLIGYSAGVLLTFAGLDWRYKK